MAALWRPCGGPVAAAAALAYIRSAMTSDAVKSLDEYTALPREELEAMAAGL